MNRPIIFLTISYITGIVISFLLFEKINMYLIAIILILFLIYVIIKKSFSYLFFILFLCLGAILFYFQNEFYPPNNIKNFSDISKIESFDCVVSDMPVIDEGKVYFIANIKNIYCEDKIYSGLSGRLRITVEQKFNTQIEYGDVLNIKAKITEPGDRKNQGQLDYKKYLKWRSISHIVYTDDTKVLKKSREIKNYLLFLSYKIKTKLIRIINASLPSYEAKILEAIMLGNQKAIPDDVYDIFKITGTAHILAVSGMNVGLIAFFLFLFLKLINIKQKYAAIIIFIFIWIFAIITGFDASIVRAAIMASFMLVGIIIDFDVDIFNSLFASALFILLFKTSHLFDIGFQLSYLATFGIIYFNDYAKSIAVKMPDYLKEIIATTITAQIFIIPVMINNFHQLSLISIIANFFIVPVSSIIVLLGFVLWGVGMISQQLALIFGASIWFFIKLMMFITEILADIPYASVSIKTLPFIFIFFYYLFFIILPYDDIDIILKKISLKNLIAVFLIIYFVILNLPDRSFKIYALSIPKINCVFVKTENNKKILILGCDSGENSGIKNILIPFLKYNGINNIDFFINYSIKKNEKILPLLRNFHIGDKFFDIDLYNQNINRLISKNTKIFIDSYKTEIEYKEKKMVFEKVLADDLFYGECIVFSCYYKLELLQKISQKCKCIINSKNRKYYKPKIMKNDNIFDVGEYGMMEMEL